MSTDFDQSEKSKERPIPGLAEWGPESSEFDKLDEGYARQIFYGKSVEETFPLFERNVIERVSDIRFMPPACFQYYILAFRDYILLDSTPSSGMAADAASCFIELVSEKMISEPATILPLLRELIPTLRHLALHQSDYDADSDIYGDFSEKVAKIEESLA